MKTAQQWINTIKCPITKDKLRTAYKNDGFEMNLKFASMLNLLSGGFTWRHTKEGFEFWVAIYKHFKSGSGRKSYKDFKHLDQSANGK